MWAKDGKYSRGQIVEEGRNLAHPRGKHEERPALHISSLCVSDSRASLTCSVVSTPAGVPYHHVIFYSSSNRMTIRILLFILVEENPTPPVRLWLGLPLALHIGTKFVSRDDVSKTVWTRGEGYLAGRVSLTILRRIKGNIAHLPKTRNRGITS